MERTLFDGRHTIILEVCLSSFVTCHAIGGPRPNVRAVEDSHLAVLGWNRRLSGFGFSYFNLFWELNLPHSMLGHLNKDGLLGT